MAAEETVYAMIHSRNNKVNTTKLIEFIKKYGVNYKDHHGICLLMVMNHMSKEQIDIVFDEKPNLMVEGDGKYLVFCQSFIDNYVYMFRKMLEQDETFLFITEKTKYYIGCERIEIIETYREMINRYLDCLCPCTYHNEKTKWMDDLLKEHEEKYKKKVSQ